MVRWMRRALRVMPLVAALVWGVALMHSLPAGAQPATQVAMAAGQASCCPASPAVVGDRVAGDPHAGDAGGDPMPGHRVGDMIHLCLAVLTGLIAGLIGAARHRSRRAEPALPEGRIRLGEPMAARPPPRPAGRTLLTSVCVLRL